VLGSRNSSTQQSSAELLKARTGNAVPASGAYPGQSGAGWVARGGLPFPKNEGAYSEGAAPWEDQFFPIRGGGTPALPNPRRHPGGISQKEVLRLEFPCQAPASSP
jgi:hypothetical protein